MKNVKIEIKWAVIFVIMTLLWMLFEKYSGLYDEHLDKHAIISNFIAIPAIIVYVLALLDKRRNHYKGSMTYMQGFVCGIWITFFVALIVPLTQYIISTYIAPEYFPNMIQYSVKEGYMSQAKAEEYFNLKNYIIQGIIGTLVMGITTTAIVAIFTRKSRTHYSPV